MFTKLKLSRLRIYSKHGLELKLDTYIDKNLKLSEGHKSFLEWYYNENTPEFIWDTLNFYKRIKRDTIEGVAITSD